MTSTRRQFLSATAAASTVVTFNGRAPAVLQQTASNSKSNGRILVVVEMAGGNDGLNTVVPFADDDYRKARPKLAIGRDDVLKIEGDLGFHPVMTISAISERIADAVVESF